MISFPALFAAIVVNGPHPPLQCPAPPVAPDEESATALFLRYEREGRAPPSRYADGPLAVLDDGASWSIWHEAPPDPPGHISHDRGGRVLVIDKCTGEILRVIYHRY